ncbi:hypothetical protein L1887_19173 [Cichorium endivia]|nr:hypothetical protein L1887_19173 [Cichorium endivia]
MVKGSGVMIGFAGKRKVRSLAAGGSSPRAIPSLNYATLAMIDDLLLWRKARSVYSPMVKFIPIAFRVQFINFNILL